MALTDKLTAIADAIRGKTGKTGEMTLDQMVTEIAGIETGGGSGNSSGSSNTIEDGLVQKTLTEYSNDRIISLPSYSFRNWVASELLLTFPNVKTVAAYTFMNCTKLIKLDIGKHITIPQYFVYDNTNFVTLILRSNELCALGNTSAFNKTPFASDGTGGTVYVPSALIESYQTATNWSNLYAAGTCNFVAIEGSEYE